MMRHKDTNKQAFLAMMHYIAELQTNFSSHGHDLHNIHTVYVNMMKRSLDSASVYLGVDATFSVEVVGDKLKITPTNADGQQLLAQYTQLFTESELSKG